MRRERVEDEVCVKYPSSRRERWEGRGGEKEEEFSKTHLAILSTLFNSLGDKGSMSGEEERMRGVVPKSWWEKKWRMEEKVERREEEEEGYRGLETQ